MHRILFRWLLGAIPVVFGVTVLTFVLTSLVPGDPGRTILGANASPAQVKALDAQLGLDHSLPVRYWDWLTDALQGNLGDSITSGVPVSDQLTSRLGVTLSLIGGAILVAAVAGVVLGVLSALKGGWLGRAVDGISLVGLAVPNFWFGLVLMTALAVQLPVFPVSGYVPFTDSPVQWFQSLVLPVLTLGVPATAPVAKQTRDGVLNQLDREYVRVLRARGVPERSVIFRHVLRNAAAPIVTVLGVVVVTLFGGTVLAETLFVMPGLGGLAVTAAQTQDIPMVQGVALVFTVTVMLINLLIEVVYTMLNPKVRT
ncbi:ABC transporter permease [Streptomyces sp. NPDC096132]|uniref:ABC transporter permease n=1 Tax=Streptomyces sp. NPDC096132 TaxID=3366075 RepID=UPI003818E4B5